MADNTPGLPPSAVPPHEDGGMPQPPPSASPAFYDPHTPNVQFDFGFTPTIDAYVNPADQSQQIAKAQQLEQRVTTSINSDLSKLQQGVFALKDKIQSPIVRESQRMTGAANSLRGKITAGLAAQRERLINHTNDTIVKVKDKTGAHVDKIPSPDTPQIPSQLPSAENPTATLPEFTAYGSGGVMGVDVGQVLPAILPGVSHIPGATTGVYPPKPVRGEGPTGKSVGGTLAPKILPGAGPPLSGVAGGVSAGGGAAAGGAVGGIVGGVPQQTVPPPTVPPVVPGPPYTDGSCPPVSECARIGDAIYGGADLQLMSPEDRATWAACEMCGYDIALGQYPQPQPPPTGTVRALLPGDVGYPYDPTDPNYGQPYYPPAPVPETPLERPLPPVPPSPVPPVPPTPGRPQTVNVSVNVPPVYVNIPPIELPPWPQPGECETPSPERAPIVPPPEVALTSLDNCFGGPSALSLEGQDVATSISELFSGAGVMGNPVGTWLEYLNGNGSLVGTAVKGLIDNVSAFVGGMTGSIATAFRCGSAELFGLISQGVLNGVIERWVSDIPDYLQRPSNYRANFLCPTIIPTTAEATSAYLGNTVDRSTLECWVRSNGNMFPEWERVVRASRQKLTVQDLIGLLRRGEIDRETYNHRVRELAFLDNEPAELLKLAEVIPAYQDLVRLMQRDVVDPNVFERFHLDDEFEAKYQGKLKEWAEWQGISDELMRFIWRSHWDIPSPQQLYYMYHRLRDLPEGDPQRVTLDDITTALKQQDIAPYWVPKLLAVSFNPLTRVDTRRAYDIGVLSNADVARSYRQLGYSDENAEVLAKFAARLKINRGAKTPAAKAYVKGLIGKVELMRRLSDDGYTDTEIGEILPKVESDADLEVKKVCLPSVEKRFLIGELDDEQARKEIDSWLRDPQQTERVLSRWTCKKASRGKTLPVTTIGRLYREGIIDASGVYTRLLNLGYSEDDAAILLNSLTLANQRELAKKEKAAMKLQQAEQAKAAKQAAKTKKEQEAAAKRLQAMQQKAQKTRDANRKAILKTAEVLAGKWTTDVAAENNWLTNEINTVRRDYAESLPFVIAAASVLAASSDADTRDTYSAALREIVSSGESAFNTSITQSSNGSSK